MVDGFSDVLFIGGTGRSGTTITGKLLSRHSQIKLSKPVEIKLITAGNGLLDLYLNPRFSRTGKIILGKEKNYIRFEKTFYEKWWSRQGKKGGPTGLSLTITEDRAQQLLRELRTELTVDRAVACQNFLRKIIDEQMPSKSTKYWVDTTPPNLMRADEIDQLFPGARFLHLIRDGRDVASSVVREPWGPNSHNEALEWWRKRMIKILRATRSLNGNVQHLWMEDLVMHNRHETLSGILDFLGLSDEPKLRTYFEEIVNPKASNTGRWKREVANPQAFDQRYKKIFVELLALGMPHPKKQT